MVHTRARGVHRVARRVVGRLARYLLPKRPLTCPLVLHELLLTRLLYLQIAVREAKRQNAAYRLHAMPALGRVAAARTDKDMSDTVYDIIAPVLTETVEKEEADDNDAMDVDGASNGTASR